MLNARKTASLRAMPRSRLVWALAMALTLTGAGPVYADAPGTDAASLRDKYGALRERLDHNQYQAELYLNSQESPDRLEGDLYGVIDHPFAVVRASLTGASQWCDVLMLHLNVKGCRASAGGAQSSLAVYVGGKHGHSTDLATQVDYAYRVAGETADYVQILLRADSGPFGTRNSRILLEAVPLDPTRTFVHLTYSYGYGLMARVAIETYLDTVGRGKVGFTSVGRQPDGRPIYVGGVRGVIERNAMRYYLAVVAYLDALSSPPKQQLESRLEEWFTLTERHPVQLHEIGRTEYLSMKRDE